MDSVTEANTSEDIQIILDQNNKSIILMTREHFCAIKVITPNTKNRILAHYKYQAMKSKNTYTRMFYQFVYHQ